MSAPAVTPVVVADHWTLDSDPGAVSNAARDWRALGSAMDGVAADLDGAAGRVSAEWHGSAHDSYQAHRQTVSADLGRLASAADTVAGSVAEMASELSAAEEQLASGWARASGICPAVRAVGVVMFLTRTPEEQQQVQDLAETASQIRVALDRRLSELAAQLSEPSATLAGIGSRRAGAGAGDPSWAPPGSAAAADPGLTVIRGDGQTLVLTGDDGPTKVVISDSPVPGMVRISSGGRTVDVPAGQPLSVNTGDSDDVVTISGTAAGPTQLVTGDGDDEVRSVSPVPLGVLAGSGDDNVRSGSGRDRVSGGTGRDYLQGNGGGDALYGGAGNDTAYGLDGDDTVGGGTGEDYLEGGTGADYLAAGDGGGVLSGGRGDDRLQGGAGDDVAYAGSGRDAISGGGGTDTAYTQREDTVGDTENRTDVPLEGSPGSYIDVEGSPEFESRVQADLEMLRSSPTGRDMLDDLQAAHEDSKAPAADWPVLGEVAYQGDPLTITESRNPDNSFASYDSNIIYDGETHSVQYSQSVDNIDGAPPSAVLYHELGHVWDYAHDTTVEGTYEGPGPDGPTDYDDGVNNSERQAVGLPLDHDDDPNTPEAVDPDHPLRYTENGLRREFGWDPRTSYR